MAGVGFWELADEMAARPGEARRTATAEVVRVDADGTAWCSIAGGAGEFPCERSTATCSPGDTVTVEIADGTATITGNHTDRSASSARLEQTWDTAGSALQGAATASAAAEVAQQLADTAASAAHDAQASADSASDAASTAWTRAGSALSAANNAQESANNAAAAAAIADGKAVEAQASARAANAAANDALVQLGTVEDVIGVVNWIAEHGEYSPTGDAAVDDSKVYYTRTGAGTQADPYVYVPVAEPTASGLPGYYELSIDAALSQYVASHLALTDAGLYVVKDANGYKLLCSNTGVSVIDPQGHVVATYGESITFDSSRSQYIGNEDAYILFTPEHVEGGQTVEASITIGGANVQLGSSKTLSEWEADMRQAVDDASAALDSAHLVITSTNGQLFKNGTESTVLQVAVFPNGGGRLDTISQVRARFGAGAYIEWRWRHDADGTWGTLPSNDPHLSQGGMWLTVAPSDVATKTSFEASLVTP